MKGNNKAIALIILAILPLCGCMSATTVEDLADSLGLKNTGSYLGSTKYISGFDENQTLVSITVNDHGFWFTRSHRYPADTMTQIADPSRPDANGIFWRKPSPGLNCTWIGAEFLVEKMNPKMVITEYERLSAIEDGIWNMKIGPDLEGV